MNTTLCDCRTGRAWQVNMHRVLLDTRVECFKCPGEKSASICNAVQCWPHQRKRASSMHAFSRKRKISETLPLLPRVQEDCQQRVHWILGHVSQKSHSLKVSQES